MTVITEALATESDACTGGVPHRMEMTTRAGMVISESCAWCGLTYRYND